MFSDGHLSWEQPIGRLDDIKKTQFRKLKFAWDWANKNNAIILTAGDFFDKPRSWYLLPEVINFLKKYPYVPVYTIFGQHDTYMYHEETRKNTSLGVLESFGLVQILGAEPKTFDYEVALYGASFGQDVPTVVDKNVYNILVIHANIYTGPLWPGHKFTRASSFLSRFGGKDFDIVLCGDIHRKFLYQTKKRMILNVGPLMRREANEYNFIHKPCFGVLDIDDFSFELIEIPHESAEKVLTRRHLVDPESDGKILSEFYDVILSESDDPDSEVDVVKNIQEWVKENKVEKAVVKILDEVMSYGK